MCQLTKTRLLLTCTCYWFSLALGALVDSLWEVGHLGSDILRDKSWVFIDVLLPCILYTAVHLSKHLVTPLLEAAKFYGKMNWLSLQRFFMTRKRPSWQRWSERLRSSERRKPPLLLASFAPSTFVSLKRRRFADSCQYNISGLANEFSSSTISVS